MLLNPQINDQPLEFKNDNNANGRHRRRRRRRQVLHGRRRAAQRAYTAVLLVTVHGMSVTEAIERCDTNSQYFCAMRALHASGNVALLNAVLSGSEPVLASARKVANAAAVITAYQKCSGPERELVRLATGATSDVVTALLNLSPDQRVATSKELGLDWVWDNLIEAAMSASKAPSKAPSEPASVSVVA